MKTHAHSITTLWAAFTLAEVPTFAQGRRRCRFLITDRHLSYIMMHGARTRTFPSHLSLVGIFREIRDTDNIWNRPRDPKVPNFDRLEKRKRYARLISRSSFIAERRKASMIVASSPFAIEHRTLDKKWKIRSRNFT